MLFVTINQGKLTFHGESRGQDMGPVVLAVPCKQTPGTINQVAELFRKHQALEVLCSSSLDFPTDGGANPNFKAHTLLDKAFNRAWR